MQNESRHKWEMFFKKYCSIKQKSSIKDIVFNAIYSEQLSAVYLIVRNREHHVIS